MARSALILVDIQNDFCPGGALAVPDGYAVVPIANAIRRPGTLTDEKFDMVIATQDWHPLDHGSFAFNHPDGKPYTTGKLDGLPQVLWPNHCVRGTPGADFHPNLDLHGVTIFRKGTMPSIDSYSGFYDNQRRNATGLTDYLRSFNVTHVSVMGLATDYCVKATAIDALDDGFTVTLIERGCRGVDLNPGDVANAIEEMRNKGVVIA